MARNSISSSPFGSSFKARTVASRFHFAFSSTLHDLLVYSTRQLGVGNGLDGLTGMDISMYCTSYACSCCDSWIVIFDRVADIIATKSYRHHQ